MIRSLLFSLLGRRPLTWLVVFHVIFQWTRVPRSVRWFRRSSFFLTTFQSSNGLPAIIHKSSSFPPRGREIPIFLPHFIFTYNHLDYSWWSLNSFAIEKDAEKFFSFCSHMPHILLSGSSVNSHCLLAERYRARLVCNQHCGALLWTQLRKGACCIVHWPFIAKSLN